MTRQALKQSTPRDEFVCLTCPLSECVPNSYRCPINSRGGPVDARTYDKIVELFTERDQLKALIDDLTAEISRVKGMKSRTKSKVNKHKANMEISRLNALLENATLRRRSLKSKHIAEMFEVPLHIVAGIGRRRFF